jgi:aspartate ammonia-lyase
MPVMAHSGIEATTLLTNGARMLRTRCIDGLQPNEPRLRRYFESTPQIATALSPRLGYERTAKLVQESLALGKSVVELAREQGLLEESELAKLLAEI